LIELGWFDNAFGRKEERIEEVKISISEVESFLKGKMEKEFEPLKDSVKKEFANLQLIADDMQNKLKILEDATYPEKTYPIIIRKSVGSRKNFVDKMNFLIIQLQKPTREDIDSIMSFHEEIDKLINVVNLETVKDYASVKILFERESKEVVQTFFQIVEIDNRLENMLRSFKESNIKLLKVKELVANISELTQELNRNESSKLENKLRETEEEEKRILDELEKLSESDEWKNLLEMKDIQEEIRQKMKNRKADLISYLSQVELPLKKYNWSAKNKVLDYYLQKSFDFILSEDTKGEIFKSALKEIKVKILENELNLKDSDKFLGIINKMIEGNTVGKMISEYLEISGEMKKQEEKIAFQAILKRKNNLENDTNRLKKEIWELKNEKETAEKRKKEAQEEREQKLEELKTILKDFSGKRILLQTN
jgi:hypothetical protein